ncbi:hypothetical protein [Mesomycoplasma lagogenitalium]|uniref:Ribosome maturation factor RimP N-terminal domain-containing protein n=1 Tax=Mesomycoplasma lagogenitalium TaxID=171286 RepID=A0ABY8LT05_9BACT|nr:hypothetical protein [Mesomycoplasma lagogenitalium]WGI36382.1 hypothetical protein QEG99_02825 [Mesomycoplasma lagogenitalium]
MTLFDNIKEKFHEILDIYFEKEGNLNFLRIKTNLTTLVEIEKLSKKISDYLDENYDSKEEYYLDIFSKGAEQEILLKNLNDFINTDLQIWFNSQDFILGKLIEVKEKSFILQVNKKGRITKEEVENEKVHLIKNYIKF